MKKLLLFMVLLVIVPYTTALADYAYIFDTTNSFMQQSTDSILEDMAPLTAQLNLLALTQSGIAIKESTAISPEYFGKCVIAFNRDGNIQEIANCKTTKTTDLSIFLGKSSGYLTAGKDCEISFAEQLIISAQKLDEVRKTTPCTIKLLKNEYAGYSAGVIKRSDEEIKSGEFLFSKEGEMEKATLFMTEKKDLVFDGNKYRLAKNTFIHYGEEIIFDLKDTKEGLELFSPDGKKSLGTITSAKEVNIWKNADGSYNLAGNFRIETKEGKVLVNGGSINYHSLNDIIANSGADVTVFKPGGGVRVISLSDPIMITSCASEIKPNSVDFCKGKEKTLRASGKDFIVAEILKVEEVDKGDIASIGLRYGMNSRLLCEYNGFPDCKTSGPSSILIPGYGFWVKDGTVTVNRNSAAEPELIMDGSVEYGLELFTLASSKDKLYKKSGEGFIEAKDAKFAFTGAGISGITKEGTTCLGKKALSSCDDGSVILKPGKKTLPILTASGDFGWPLDITSINYLSQCIHNGVDIDLAPPEGTPVYAIDNGIVTKVCKGDKKNCYCPDKSCTCGKCGENGNHVAIDFAANGKHLTSLYIHLKTVGVKEGQAVRKGQQLGTVGNVGYSAGPHLHWRLFTADFGAETTNPLCLYPATFLESIYYKGGNAIACKEKSPCGAVNPDMKRISVA